MLTILINNKNKKKMEDFINLIIECDYMNYLNEVFGKYGISYPETSEYIYTDDVPEINKKETRGYYISFDIQGFYNTNNIKVIINAFRKLVEKVDEKMKVFYFYSDDTGAKSNDKKHLFFGKYYFNFDSGFISGGFLTNNLKDVQKCVKEYFKIEIDDNNIFDDINKYADTFDHEDEKYIVLREVDTKEEHKMDCISSIIFKFKFKYNLKKVESLIEKFYDNNELYKTFDKYEINYPDKNNCGIDMNGDIMVGEYYYRALLIDTEVTKEKLDCFRELINKLKIKAEIFYITEWANGEIQSNDKEFEYAEKYHYMASYPNKNGEYEAFTSDLEKIVEDVNYAYGKEYTVDNIFEGVAAISNELEKLDEFEYITLHETKLVML